MYKDIWTPEIKESLVCNRDQLLEAKELDENAIGTYKNMAEEEVLVGHLSIELSKLIEFFIDTEDNHIQAVVTSKRKREVGLSVPAKYNSFTPSKRHAKILHDELLKRKNSYSCLSFVVEEFVDRKQAKFT